MSDASDIFLAADTGNNIKEVKTGNSVMLFTDNRKLFASILADLVVTDGENDFVYLAGWWCDVDIPLGDPNTKAPTFREILSNITKPKIDPSVSSELLLPGEPNPVEIVGTKPGAQVCAMLWRHKNQRDFNGLPVTLLSLPVSIFGDPLLASINTEAIKHIRGLTSDSQGILDGNHRLFGSHHQKLLVLKNKRSGLIAYVGSTDFNADRLYPKGAKVKNSPTTDGAPLEDVAVRFVGPAAGDVLSTFVERWKLHPEGKHHKLRGDGYIVPPASVGPASIQVTHTYGKDYPFKGSAIRSAAASILKMVASAQQYIYFEDQYLIGTTELSRALRDRLNSNTLLTVIAVMAPLEVVGDLYWLGQRRSDFWRMLADLYPLRVKLFEMTNRHGSKSGDGSYLHAKLALVDDTVAALGSANCSNRSWYHDSEILVTISGDATDSDEPRALAARLRLERWSRHLGTNKKEILNVRDGIAKWSRLPSTALVKQWKPLRTPLSINQQYLYEQIFDPR